MTKCAHCGDVFEEGEIKVLVDDEPMHPDCAVEDSDNVFFDDDIERE